MLMFSLFVVAWPAPVRRTNRRGAGWRRCGAGWRRAGPSLERMPVSGPNKVSQSTPQSSPPSWYFASRTEFLPEHFRMPELHIYPIETEVLKQPFPLHCYKYEILLAASKWTWSGSIANLPCSELTDKITEFSSEHLITAKRKPMRLLRFHDFPLAEWSSCNNAHITNERKTQHETWGETHY